MIITLRGQRVKKRLPCSERHSPECALRIFSVFITLSGPRSRLLHEIKLHLFLYYSKLQLTHTGGLCECVMLKSTSYV